MVNISVSPPPSGYGWAYALQQAINSAPDNPATLTNVVLPSGRYPWVVQGESGLIAYYWGGFRTVNVPSTKFPLVINGAGMVWTGDWNTASWNTELYQTVEGGGNCLLTESPTWFIVNGAGVAGKTFRLTGLKLEGYRSLHPSSTSMSRAIELNNVIDFRVDHCNLEHTTSGSYTGGLNCRGVFDHDKIWNPYAMDNLVEYSHSTVGYGFFPAGSPSAPILPAMSVLGKYTNQTTFIEDCYLRGWRHIAASNNLAHYVIRHCLIDQDLAHYSFDVHGGRNEGHPGGRAVELYENTFQNAASTQYPSVWNEQGGSPLPLSSPSGKNAWFLLLQIGSGCGVWFNNSVDTTFVADGMYLGDDGNAAFPGTETKDWYMWSPKGTLNPPRAGGSLGFPNSYADWSRQAGNLGDANYPNVNPSWSIAGYVPYTYPHPLVGGAPELTTPQMLLRSAGNYQVTVPQTVTVGGKTYTFDHWEVL